MRELTPQYLIKHGIYEDYHNRTIDGFEQPKTRAFMKKVINDFDNLADSNGGFYLFGSNGTGKTTAMNILLMEALKERYTAYCTDIQELSTKFTDGWKDEDEKKEYENMIEVDFLGVDDIGKEFNFNKLGIQLFEQILRFRSKRKKFTFITSNNDKDDVESLYKSKGLSSLLENYVVVHFKGDDMRNSDKLKKKYL